MVGIHNKIIFITITIGLSSCSSIYVPTTPNIPLFKNGGEFQIESSVLSNGLNVKSAFSPLNHIGMQLNGHYFYQILQTSNPNYHYYIDGALGLYQNFNDKFFSEIYFGYGEGKSSFSDQFYGGEQGITIGIGDYKKTYCQIDGGYSWKQNYAFRICVRIADIEYNYSYAYSYKWLIGNTYNHLSVEPYLCLSTDINKTIEYICYLGVTLIENMGATIRTDVINAGAGFRFNLGRNGN